MRIGLCLCGGGAKGAYQAGVIKALNDKGIKFNFISGTSIGSVNGYFIFTNNVEKLEEMWTDVDAHVDHHIKIVNNTVDNSNLIDLLSNINDNNPQKTDFYVNYINIENNIPKEKIVNILDLSKEERLNSIKYSSLLPFNPQGTMGLNEQFMKDLSEGLYNGYNLDGGLVNNTLLKPLLNKDLDKIIVISTKH
ncbi:MAG: patatin-like phospholipase family protein, partial [Romboutsia sp.]|nr:patatin-like phospholipase family protein [Romboutsia sp.]